MGQFFDLIREAIDAAKQPKEAAVAIYHGIMQRGARALKDPETVGKELNAHYDLNLSMYFSFILFLALISGYVTGLGDLLHGRSGIIAFLFAPILIAFVQLLAVWFIGPFLDRLGYRIFGLSVSLERAREVAFAAGLPSASPIMLGALYAITVLGSFIPPLRILSLLIFPFVIFLIVQSFRVRKHTLDTSYTVAICGPLLMWFLLGMVVVFPFVLFIGAMSIAAAH